MSVELRVGKKYRLGKKIGSGSFGDLYLGVNVQTGEDVAIKLEPVRSSYPQLMREAKVYRAIEKDVGIPRMRWCGVAQDYNVLVIDLLGKSLEDLFENCGRRFSLKTVLSLADQILTRLECLHTRGFMHRDVKPDNFLMGRGAQRAMVYMIDFGLSKYYCHPTNKRHISFVKGKKLTGTVRYASINAHHGCELSRRDDLESLAYCFIYFLNGKLPWQGLKVPNKNKKYEHILELKETIEPEMICRGLPVEFCSFLKYVRNLKFDETPDYIYMRQLFSELFFRAGFRHDNLFDWDLEPQERSKLNFRRPSPPPPRRNRSTQRAEMIKKSDVRKQDNNRNNNSGEDSKKEVVKLPNIFYGLRNRGLH